MFPPMVKKLLNTEHFFNENSLKSKLKTKGEFGWSWYCWKPLDEEDYMKAIWKCLKLSSGGYWILNSFCHGKFNYITKNDIENKN
jgi:hypothetical protein